jgi:hypothetical protein
LIQKVVIVDLDGTLALNKHRYHFIDKNNQTVPNWNAYFLACDKDEPNQAVVNTVSALKDAGYTIHIFSARGKIAHDETRKWLAKYLVPYDHLTMRDVGNFVPDEELKKSWLLEFYPDFKYTVMCVLDDRDKVVNMWRSLGVTCFQVAEGDF